MHQSVQEFLEQVHKGAEGAVLDLDDTAGALKDQRWGFRCKRINLQKHSNAHQGQMLHIFGQILSTNKLKKISLWNLWSKKEISGGNKSFSFKNCELQHNANQLGKHQTAILHHWWILLWINSSLRKKPLQTMNLKRKSEKLSSAISSVWINLKSIKGQSSSESQTNRCPLASRPRHQQRNKTLPSPGPNHLVPVHGIIPAP